MRLIDADKLKEKMEAHKRFYVNAYGGFEKMPYAEKVRVDEITSFIADIVNASTVEVPTWIPVTERLPHEEWEEAVANGMDLYSCLAAEKYDGFKPVVVKAWFDGEGFIDIVGIDISIRITHWMPHPDAPKDGDT